MLSATTGGVFICSFTSVVGAPVGIPSASFTLILSLTKGNSNITSTDWYGNKSWRICYNFEGKR